MYAKDINLCPYEIVKKIKNQCAQVRSYFYENTVVCTSGLIVCKRHTPKKNHPT